MSAARVVLFAQVINTISFFVKWEQKVFWRSQLVLSACYLHDRQTAQASVSVDTDHHPNTSEAAEAEVAISTSNQSDLLEGPKKKVLGRGWPQKKGHILECIGTRAAPKAGGLKKGHILEGYLTAGVYFGRSYDRW